jgi:hypothetical protein
MIQTFLFLFEKGKMALMVERLLAARSRASFTPNAFYHMALNSGLAWRLGNSRRWVRNQQISLFSQ